MRKPLLPTSVTDAAVMRLPHPARMVPTMGPFFDALEQMLGREWPIIRAELADDTAVLPEAIRRMTTVHRLPRFTEILTTSTFMPGGTEQGGALGLLAYLRHRVAPAPHFLLDDHLVGLLEHTDIAQDLPLSMFNLPYRRFYVELGRGRTCGCTIPNALSGDHVLEGAYVERGQHVDGDYIYLVLTGSPLGKTDAADDATLSMALPVADLDRPIHEVITEAHRRAQLEAAPAGLVLSPDEWTNDAFKAVMLLAKALLYIGMPGTRRALHPEKTEALKSFGLIKSTAKRAKAQRRLDRAYDYVLVTAQPEHEGVAGNLARSGAMRAHWRRGHYRMQAHGPQHSQRKLIFLQPMLVGASSADETPAQPAEYRVA